MAGRRDDPFAHIYVGARKLEAVMKSGDKERIAKLDFGVAPQCMRCAKICVDQRTGAWTPMRCGRCHAVIYCSRECQVADWKQSAVAGAPSHKQLCPRNQEHMKRLPYFRAELLQFPWARIEKDGTCPHELFLARLGVLGSGPKFGYWSMPGGNQPHDDSDSQVARSPVASLFGKQYSIDRNKAYIHGEVLLSKQWPTDVEAWKLTDEQHVPHLFFTDEIPPPPKVSPGQIKDWASWYKWRGLEMSSPVVLLMDYPLTVYHLLVNVLKVVRTDSSPGSRQSLEVHYIGAEVELNFLPLFSELALLLPNTDIKLIVFGKPVHDLVRRARSEAPDSLAAKSNPIWEYTAPKLSGGGSISIQLYSKSETWGRLVVADDQLVPDAMVGLNAGLATYITWTEPVLFSAILSLPFAVTDYAEQSLETTANSLPNIRAHSFEKVDKSSPQFANLIRPREHPITVNPFHRPGQRGLPVIRMPNCYNGFCMVVEEENLGKN